MEYVYAPKMRSLRRGSGPDGHLRMDKTDGRGPFGVIVYGRPLSRNEIVYWDLATIEMPRVTYIVSGVRSNGNTERLLTWNKPMPGAFDEAEQVALNREMEFEDYVVEPKPS